MQQPHVAGRLGDYLASTVAIAPEALVELLNLYFDRLISVVFDHGGTIDKTVGDSMHVLFNAPLEQPDHAERAVRCAIALDRASPGPGGVGGGDHPRWKVMGRPRETVPALHPIPGAL